MPISLGVTSNFTIDQNLTVGGTATVTSGLTLSSTTASSLLYGNASKAVSSVILHSNLTLTTGTLALAAALTGINSVTAAVSTDLTLTGGSTGASLVLGQGPNAGVTVTGAGTGITATGVNTGALRNANIGLSGNSGGPSYFGGSIRPTGDIRFNSTDNYIYTDSGSSLTGIEFAQSSNLLNFWTTNVIRASISSAGVFNLATTTAASSSTTGALTIGNGTAATNVAIGGGVIYAGSKISVNNSGLGGVRLGVTSTVGGEIGVYADSTATTGNNIGIASAPSGVGAASNTGFWANPTSGTNNIGFLAGNITPPAVTASFYGTGKIITTDTTPSTNTTSGALQVAGGVGVGAASVFGSTVTAGGTTGFATGSLSDGGTGFNASGVGSVYGLVVNRSATNKFGLISYRTVTAEKWAVGMRETGDNYFRFYSSGAFSNDVLTLRDDTGAATFAGAVSASGTTATWTSGTGSPESVVTAPVGSLYTRTNGGASTTLYVKESGAGNTGWIAK